MKLVFIRSIYSCTCIIFYNHLCMNPIPKQNMEGLTINLTKLHVHKFVFLKYYAIAICNNNTHEHPNNKIIAQTTVLAITKTTTTQTTTLTMMMTTQQQLTRTSKLQS